MPLGNVLSAELLWWYGYCCYGATASATVRSASSRCTAACHSLHGSRCRAGTPHVCAGRVMSAAGSTNCFDLCRVSNKPAGHRQAPGCAAPPLLPWRACTHSLAAAVRTRMRLLQNKTNHQHAYCSARDIRDEGKRGWMHTSHGGPCSGTRQGLVSWLGMHQTLSRPFPMHRGTAKKCHSRRSCCCT